MVLSPVWSYFVLVLTSAVLFYAAFTDLRHFKISNELVAVLAALFFVHSFISGRWINLHWNLLVAVCVSVLLFIGYAKNALGGGDVKMLTVAALWVGYDCVLVF